MNEGPSLGSRLGAAFIVWSGFGAVAWTAFHFRHDRASQIGMLIAWAWYCWSVLSITVFIHRGLTHGSVRFKWWFERLGILTGAFPAFQGMTKFWTTTHKTHHAKADRPGDPHSPNLHGDGFWGMVLGLIHAHFGWFFTQPEPDYEKYMPDRYKHDVRLNNLDQWFLPSAIISLILPGLIEVIFIHTWYAFVTGILWRFVGMWAVHHATWAINSLGHFFGSRPNRTGDRSTNVWWLALITFGEAWHNEHHSNQKSARFGQYWWQIDLGYYFIRLCVLLKLAVIVREQKELTYG